MFLRYLQRNYESGRSSNRTRLQQFILCRREWCGESRRHLLHLFEITHFLSNIVGNREKIHAMPSCLVRHASSQVLQLQQSAHVSEGVEEMCIITKVLAKWAKSYYNFPVTKEMTSCR